MSKMHREREVVAGECGLVVLVRWTICSSAVVVIHYIHSKAGAGPRVSYIKPTANGHC